MDSGLFQFFLIFPVAVAVIFRILKHPLFMVSERAIYRGKFGQFFHAFCRLSPGTLPAAMRISICHKHIPAAEDQIRFLLPNLFQKLTILLSVFAVMKIT